MRAISISIRPTSADACSHSWLPERGGVALPARLGVALEQLLRASPSWRPCRPSAGPRPGFLRACRAKRSAPRATCRANASVSARVRLARTSPGATGPSRRTRAYHRASSGRTLWLMRAMRRPRNHCACVAHGVANLVSSSSGPARGRRRRRPGRAGPLPRARPVDPEQGEVLAIRSGKRLVAVGANTLDRLLRVQAHGRGRSAVDIRVVRGRRPRGRVVSDLRPVDGGFGTPPRLRLTEATTPAASRFDRAPAPPTSPRCRTAARWCRGRPWPGRRGAWRRRRRAPPPAQTGSAAAT